MNALKGKIGCILFLMICLLTNCSQNNLDKEKQNQQVVTTNNIVEKSIEKNARKAETLEKKMDKEDAFLEEKFEILINRSGHENNLVSGSFWVNREFLGTCYERYDKRIQAGKYPGFLRYISTKGNVTGPMGTIADVGDFYLEIGNVTWSDGKKRSNLLFHAGNKPKHSDGCVMLGAVSHAGGKRHLPEGHLLRELRKRFYGTEFPDSCPNVNIEIEIQEAF